ncbi:Esterase, SGNH hydrolase-type [Penicillium expansum]|uniref:Esterase, SGNH hydrolase-type n=1 Tax=Penicillium expansum TaxID=27334 RepID=A0A0A2IHT5_PENEN|nr:Esterase, SGNH hydrolase-type [Penicillium expansum]KGO39835.1 Esterase, SGNH hydrolase-type [Penicillium expansum]KGO61230.1 Esterase, SGNH hydrolase-type [Penicillium expansum]KGO69968.1 Esterase, SGNH hydrolase-type [Penicillium expansum]
MASLIIRQANAKAVFAHFMVTNSENYTLSNWNSDMTMTKDAHIDAFALNMAWKDGTNEASVKMAFTAANTDVVIDMIQTAKDRVTVKAKTNCFLMPDWSSVGAKLAVALANGVADGLFSWSAWSWGNQTMDTYGDASYLQYLDGKPYMMAISPWFYTNLPGYNKNWLWKGDSLWFDRWQQLFALDPMPEFVQIISWNDYGECHHIGPVIGKSMAAFEIGESNYNYAMDYPHDDWREVLPFMIDLYKTGKSSMTDDKVVFWYRPNLVSACATGGTTVSTASQLQIEFEPVNVLEDRIFVMALLQDGNHGVIVDVNADAGVLEWDSRPDDELGPGLRFGSYPASPGKVKITLYKGDVESASAVGWEISSRCGKDINNYNAWVGSLTGKFQTAGSYNTEVDLADQDDVDTSGVKIPPNLIWATDPTGAQCDASQRKIIGTEFGYAIETVQAAQKYLQTGEYYQTFFAPSVRARPNFAKEAVAVYRRIEEMLDGTANFKVKITCHYTNNFRDRKDLATMNALHKTVNICERFFRSEKMAPTSERIAQIPPTILEAHHSLSTIIVHEMTHTKAAFLPPSDKSTFNGRDFIARDFTYGPDGSDGLCSRELSGENADNWALITAGIYFSWKCKTTIPIPSTGPSTTDAGCTQYNDVIIDQNDGDGFEPTGMVSFGDSFAAGMGTAKATGDKCRVGSNNYGTLLNKYLGEEIPFERKVCSGDTTTGLERQIKEWKSQSTASFATLTMGGNDIGFSDIALSCVVQPWSLRSLGKYRELCLESEHKAGSLLNDQGETGLRHKLKTLYKSILDKAEKTEFNLFVTGYIGFFNQDTIDCDQSSFDYWKSDYQPSGNRVMLTRDLRTELNVLVGQLNNMIEDAVRDANAKAKTTQVHYVDVQKRFDSHRWCEQGSWHEPDSSVPSTYFFLSSWPDLPLENEVAQSSNSDDMAALMQAGSINLPNSSNCNASLGSDPDPYVKWLCMVSVEIDANPNGEWAQDYAKATQGIANGNVNVKEINMFYPTSQIKAFHPRSPSMALYRDAILEKIDAVYEPK